jgi:hypothetical protein
MRSSEKITLKCHREVKIPFRFITHVVVEPSRGRHLYSFSFSLRNPSATRRCSSDYALASCVWPFSRGSPGLDRASRNPPHRRLWTRHDQESRLSTLLCFPGNQFGSFVVRRFNNSRGWEGNEFWEARQLPNMPLVHLGLWISILFATWYKIWPKVAKSIDIHNTKCI